VIILEKYVPNLEIKIFLENPHKAEFSCRSYMEYSGRAPVSPYQYWRDGRSIAADDRVFRVRGRGVRTPFVRNSVVEKQTRRTFRLHSDRTARYDPTNVRHSCGVRATTVAGRRYRARVRIEFALFNSYAPPFRTLSAAIGTVNGHDE